MKQKQCNAAFPIPAVVRGDSWVDDYYGWRNVNAGYGRGYACGVARCKLKPKHKGDHKADFKTEIEWSDYASISEEVVKEIENKK